MRRFIAVFLIGIGLWCSFGPATAASAVEDFSAWRGELPLRLVRDFAGAGAPAQPGLLPVDVDFTLKAAECSAPEREIRLIHEAPGGARTAVPFQLSGLTVWHGDAGTTASDATLNGTITFFEPETATLDSRYLILYGNPAAAPPVFESDLRATGEWPRWVVENSQMTVTFREGDPVKPAVLHDVFGDCGMISSVTLKSRPEAPITNKFKTLHWNPGVLIPGRGFINTHVWDPPEIHTMTAGPVFVEVHLAGPLPAVPEMRAEVIYRFFPARSYVWCSSSIRATRDIGVVTLRINELVFDQGFFTNLVWLEGDTLHQGPLDRWPVANTHGDILRLDPEVPLIAAWNPESGVGAASVNLRSTALGPRGEPAVEFQPGFHVTRGVDPLGSGGLLFWFQTRLNFSPDWDRRELIRIPAGTVYATESYFNFYEPEAARPLGDSLDLLAAARHAPDQQIGPHPYAPKR